MSALPAGSPVSSSTTDSYSALDDPDELALLAVTLPASESATARLEAIFAVDAIHCAACAATIQAAVAGLADGCSVNPASRRVRITWNPAVTTLAHLARKLAASGYPPRPIALDALDMGNRQALRFTLWQMLAAGFCAMQVMMYAVPRYLASALDISADQLQLLRWAELVLTLPVLVFSTKPFFTRAWADLRKRRIGMDVPVALGITVTFLASVWALRVGEAGAEVYFDSLTMFVAILLLARWTEFRAFTAATRNLADSLATLPRLVRRIGEDGVAKPTAVTRLRPDDHIELAQGDRIPADGVLELAPALIDESLLTGESTSLHKQPGDALVAGSVCLSGPVRLLVTRSAKESRLAEIVQLVNRAATERPAMIRHADRLAGPFLAGVLLLAALAGAVWSVLDAQRAPWVVAAVLIVTCPCALALAAPASLLAAMSALARCGVLVRSPVALERLAQAKHFVFDKTGTLTLPGTTEIQLIASGISAQKSRVLADLLARHSTHPLARALQTAAPYENSASLGVRKVSEIAGCGVEAEVLLDGSWQQVRLGSAAFATSGVQQGKANVYLGVSPPGSTGGAPGAWAAFSINETVRPSAAAVLRSLRQHGAQIFLLSGDSPSRVEAVAATLGIAHWQGGATPADKLIFLGELQRKEQRSVALIGDGINDAPAMRAADVSVCFAQGAPLAQHSADIILLANRLDDLAYAHRLARHAMGIVRQGLGFSLVYNLIGVPLAALGMLPPWLAGIGMALSSLLVVLNALRAGKLAGEPAVSVTREAASHHALPAH